MRVNSQDVISRETQSSARNLLLVSASIIAVQVLGYNQQDWRLLDRNIPPEHFTVVSLVLLAFLTVNHLVKWRADLFLYQEWFSQNSVPRGSFDEIGSIESNQGIIDGLKQQVKFVNDCSRSVESSTRDVSSQVRSNIDSSIKLSALEQSISNTVERMEELEQRFAEANRLLGQLGKRFQNVDLIVKAEVFGWYFALPFLFSIAALVATFYPS